MKKTQTVRFNVKDGSVKTFLSEKLLVKPEEGERRNSPYPVDASAYGMMRDQMLFKKDCGIKIGETIKIELFDRAQGSGKELVNTYTYKAFPYDDVAIVMVLEHFSVEGKEA